MMFDRIRYVILHSFFIYSLFSFIYNSIFKCFIPSHLNEAVVKIIFLLEFIDVKYKPSLFPSFVLRNVVFIHEIVIIFFKFLSQVSNTVLL